MVKFKFLTGVIFLISVFVLLGVAGKAHALSFGWYGTSQLCYYGELKGSPDQEIVIKIVNLKIQAGCLNEQDTSIDCKSGDGNSGSFIIDAFPTTSVGTDKLKNVVYINGCIDLAKYDTHYKENTVIPKDICSPSSPLDDNCHIHICLPLSNINKVEIEGSATVSTLDVYYDVRNTNNNKIQYSAHQICSWPGEIDQNTCIPKHNGDAPGGAYFYDCTEEQIIN